MFVQMPQEERTYGVAGLTSKGVSGAVRVPNNVHIGRSSGAGREKRLPPVAAIYSVDVPVPT
jgi:hypothetical protein